MPKDITLTLINNVFKLVKLVSTEMPIPKLVFNATLLVKLVQVLVKNNVKLV